MTKNSVDDDIDLVAKAQSLGEHERVIKMCRDVLANLSTPDYLEKIVRLRGILIRSLAWDPQTEQEKDEIEKQYALLFENHLTRRDRLNAARTLLDKADSFKDLRCWESLSKLTELFSQSNDPSILEVVRDAFNRKLEICATEDPDFPLLCADYGRFLEHPQIDINEAIATLYDFDEWLRESGMHEHTLAIAKSFVEA